MLRNRLYKGAAAAALGLAMLVALPVAYAEVKSAWGAATYFGPVINQAQAATVTSTVMELYVHQGLAIQIDYGNVTGTLAFKASNDNVTYYTVADVVLTNPAGSASGQIVEIGNLRARYYRVDYTHTSGTGLLKITTHAKEGVQ